MPASSTHDVIGKPASGLPIFISWKIAEAQKILAQEKQLESIINVLSPEAKEIIENIGINGEGGHGETPGIGEVVKLTEFLGRDMTGPIILARYRDFFYKWAQKQTPQ